MRARTWIILMLVVSVAACEDKYYENDAEHYLRLIEEQAKKGFLPTLVEKFNSQDSSLKFAEKQKEEIAGKPAAEYRKEWRQRVAKVLLANWAAVEKSELKSANNPEEQKPKTREWNRKMKEKYDLMFETLAHPELSQKWKALSDERVRIETGLAGKLAGEDAERVKGKMLAWNQGYQSKDIFDCVLEVVKPLVTDKEWLIEDKPPSEAARKAAWGTLAVHADMQYSEYASPATRPGEKKVEVRVPTILKLAIRPRIPSKPDLPAEWKVSVGKANPESIFKGMEHSAKGAALKLTIERLREMQAEACQKIKDTGIPR